jgi:hypothetical protein
MEFVLLRMTLHERFEGTEELVGRKLLSKNLVEYYDIIPVVNA